MKITLLIGLFLLTACTVPVKQEFPKVPNTFLEKPVLLEVVPENSSFSNMLDVMLDNYSSYYVISERLIAWQEWYKQQKEMFEKVK